MGKRRVKVSDMAEFVEVYNPFLLRDRNGRLMTFATYEALYLEFLKRLHEAGPVMLDCVLFVIDNFGMTYPDAVRFVSLWRLPGDKKDLFLLIDWKDGGRDRDNKLEMVARGMHLLSETKFDKDMFLSALSKFKSLINAN